MEVKKVELFLDRQPGASLGWVAREHKEEVGFDGFTEEWTEDWAIGPSLEDVDSREDLPSSDEAVEMAVDKLDVSLQLVEVLR